MQARMLSFIVMVTIIISGCVKPGGESFNLGLALEKQNRIEESYSMFAEALKIENANEEYLTAFNRVKIRLTTLYVDRAKSFLGIKPPTFNNLQQALTMAEKALKFDGGNQEIQKYSEDIKRQMNEMIARADTLNLEATSAVEANKWKIALDKYNDIREFYPEYPDLILKPITVQNNAVSYYMKEADKCKSAGEMVCTISMLSLAREISPDSQGIAAALSEAKAQNTPDYFITKAAEFAQKKDWENVVEQIRKAKALNPGTDTNVKIEKMISDVSSIYLDRVNQKLASGDIYSSFEDMMFVRSNKGSVGNDQREAELNEDLMFALRDKAESYENKGKLGNALLWYEKVQQISGGQKDIFLKIQSLKEILKQRVIKKIAVMDFTAPTTNADSGRIMTDNLLSYLTKNSSNDVKIFARDVLGAILKEIEMGQAGLYDIESAKKSGKLKGTDVFIFGSVLQYNVEKNNNEGMKMANVVTGKKTIANPAYAAWSAMHRSPSDSEMRQAPNQTIEEDVKEIIKYKVATYTKTANIDVSFRLIDVEDGEVVTTKTLKNKKEATDTYSEGVDFANIPFKELKLPSDSELLEQVMEKTIAELGYSVLSRFQNLQVVYSNSAEMMEKKGNYENAVEKYVDALHAEEVKNVSTQVSDNVRKQIERILKKISFETGKSDNSKRITQNGNSENKPSMKPSDNHIDDNILSKGDVK